MDDHVIFIWSLRSPMKLRERCLQCVAQMLMEMNNNLTKEPNRWRCNNLDEDSSAWLADVKNVFLNVPGSFIPEIISKMVEMADNGFNEEAKVKIDKDLLSVLLCKPIKRLDLALDVIQTKDFEEVFRIIKQELTVLKLRRTGYLDDYVLDPTFPNLPMHLRDMSSLTHLEIDLNCDDTLLEAVGGGCPNLKLLNVRSFYTVTSGGLKSLCLNAKDSTKRCQKLEVLILSVLIQSPTDALAALLLGLPQLTVLKFNEWCSRSVVIMASVFRLAYDNDQQQNTKLNIQKIPLITRDFCQLLHPLHLSSMCPHLKTLTLSGLSNDQLGSFPVMPTLRAVSFQCTGNKSEFEHGVIPFLQNNGEYLQNLAFTESPYLNYTKIDQLCKNLKVLHLNVINTIDGSLSPEPHFTNLQQFGIEQNRLKDDKSISRLIRFISNCHNLRRLSISLEEWTMDHLVDIISQNPFRDLISIEIKSDYMYINGETSDAGTPLSKFLHTLPEESRELTFSATQRAW